jgi:hypothetical protein
LKRATVRIALLHVREAERVPLVSAVNSISTAALLPATLEWTRVDDAELLITDEDQVETEPTFAALQAERPRTRLRYSGQRGTAAEITRPIRVQLLTDALLRAIVAVQAQPPSTGEAAASARDLSPAAPLRGRVYRGQRY